jgi:hypothetical protein
VYFSRFARNHDTSGAIAFNQMRVCRPGGNTSEAVKNVDKMGLLVENEDHMEAPES